MQKDTHEHLVRSLRLTGDLFGNDVYAQLFVEKCLHVVRTIDSLKTEPTVDLLRAERVYEQDKDGHARARLEGEAYHLYEEREKQ